MKGSVQFHAPAGRFYISWYPVRVWKNPITGEPFWAKRSAEKILDKMRCEEDAGMLILKSYMPDSPLTISAVSTEWLKAFTGTEATRKFYRKMIGDAIKYFGAEFDIRHFTHSKLQIYFNELPFTPRGKYHRLSSLKAMLSFAVRDSLIARVPPFPKLPQGLKQEIKYLTLEQQKKVLSFIPERHRGVFEFAMEYGLRIGEVCALQWDCVTDTEIIIRRAMSDGRIRQSTKTGKSRCFGRTERANSIIKRLIRESTSPFVFTRDRGKPYTWKSLTCWWRSATKKAGIHINLYNGIRHSLGCQLMDQGVEMEMVRDVLGHTSTNTTRMYAKRSSASITNILQWRGKAVSLKEARG